MREKNVGRVDEYKKDIQDCDKEIKTLKDKSKKGFDNDGLQNLKSQTEELRLAVARLTNEKAMILQRNNGYDTDAAFQLQIDDPPIQTGITRAMIFGRVVSLFDVNDEKFNIALGVISDFKLLNVVTASKDVNEALIKHKCLRKRETLIPADVKTKPNLTKGEFEKFLNKAKNSDKKCWMATDCIKFNQNKFKSVFNYIFGNYVICETSELAKTLCYSDENKMKGAVMVSLEGDLFRLGGTISGGFRHPNNNIVRYKEFKTRKARFDKSNNDFKDHMEKVKISEDKKMEFDVSIFK